MDVRSGSADVDETPNTGLLQGVCALDAHFPSQSSETHRSKYRPSDWGTFNDFGNDGQRKHYGLHSGQEGEQASSGATFLSLALPETDHCSKEVIPSTSNFVEADSALRPLALKSRL
jgi:hypothetical protein